MATKRFRQKWRNTKKNRKNRKGGLLGQQNPNKSNEDNEHDWTTWYAKDPKQYPYYDDSMYYPSSNIFNMGQKPAPLTVPKLKTEKQIKQASMQGRSFTEKIFERLAEAVPKLWRRAFSDPGGTRKACWGSGG